MPHRKPRRCKADEVVAMAYHSWLMWQHQQVLKGWILTRQLGAGGWRYSPFTQTEMAIQLHRWLGADDPMAIQMHRRGCGDDHAK